MDGAEVGKGFEKPVGKASENRHRPRGVASTIKDIMMAHAPDYAPRYDIGVALDDTERAILYAFEYGTTSKPERRDAAIKKALGGANWDVANIPTGLHEVLNTTRENQGQILVRTDRRVGTIDFSESQRGRVSFHRSEGSSSVESIGGTVICIRVPTTAPARHQTQNRVVALSPTAVMGDQRKRQLVVLSPEPALRNSASLQEVFAQLEAGVRRALSNLPGALIGLNLAGLECESKVLAGAVQYLATMPLGDSRVVLLVDRTHYISMARTFFDSQGKSAASPVVVLDGYELKTVGVAPATGEEVRSAETSIFGWEARTLAEEILRLALARAAVTDLVTHSGGAFLVEGKYYTTTFFEVRRLGHDPVLAASFRCWMRRVIDRISPSVVVAGTAFIESMLKAAPRLPGEPVVLPMSGTNPSIVGLRATVEAKGGKVLFLADVLCRGSAFGAFATSFNPLENAVLVSLIDARPEAPIVPQNTWPIPTAAGTVNVPFIAAVRQPVTPTKDRPAGVPVRSVAIIDPATNSPTQYALPAPAAMEPERALQAASSHGALAVGHFVLDRKGFSPKHYVYFLSLEPLFQSLRHEIAAWLELQFKHLSARRPTQNVVTTVLCPSDQIELEAQVRKVAGNALVRVLSDEDLAAPPASAQGVHTAWVVLPISASGETLRKFLRYAAMLGAQIIHCSSVASRLKPEDLKFYESIQRYEGAEVSVETMFALPLAAFTSLDCPACKSRAFIGVVRTRIGSARPRLYMLANREHQRLTEMDARGAASLSEGSREGASLLFQEVLIRAEFEAALQDSEKRKRVRDILTRGNDALGSFVCGVGRSVGYGEYQDQQQRKRVIYFDPQDINFHEYCRRWSTEDHKEPVRLLLMLLGFAQLVPDSLRGVAANIVSKTLDSANGLCFEAGVLACTIRPDVLATAFFDCPTPSDEERARLLEDLRSYLRSDAFVDATRSRIGVLLQLKTFLVRSTAWGLSLDTLKLQLSLSKADSKQVSERLSVFMVDGARGAENRLLAAYGALWDHLDSRPLQPRGQLHPQQNALTRGWGRIRATFGRMLEIGEEIVPPIRASQREELLRTIAELEVATSDFVACLDQISTRPARLRKDLYNAIRSVQVTVEVADDCPLVACHHTDLLALVQPLVENTAVVAKEQGSEARMTLRFSRENEWIVLEVADDLKWRPGRQTEGGLARVREILERYGGQLDLPITEREGGTKRQHLRIRLPPWEETALVQVGGGP